MSYSFHYRGRGESGTEYVIPPGFYTPYEDVFSMATFSYLVDQHLGLVGPYGITMSTERAIALQRATRKPLVFVNEVTTLYDDTSLQQWFTAGDQNGPEPMSANLGQNFRDIHGSATGKRMFGIAPHAADMATRQPHQGAGPTDEA